MRKGRGVFKRWGWLSSSSGRGEFLLLSPLVEPLSLTTQEKSYLIVFEGFDGRTATV